jgi:hypothetical protein
LFRLKWMSKEQKYEIEAATTGIKPEDSTRIMRME